MAWSDYGAFVLVAVLLTLVPGPDVAVVVKNALHGRRRGAWCAVGVTTSNALQGAAAAAGLAAALVQAEPLFRAVRWAGTAYLVYLGVQSLYSAAVGRYAFPGDGDPGAIGQAWTGWRQGFLSNVTNPKVLAFYLAVLPQFLGPDPGPATLLALALTHAVLSLAYLLALVAGVQQAGAVLARRAVRRVLDAVTGVALLAFGARLAVEQV